ncbi:hypothetical protein DPMN_145505 [Dreissena polymorpha]|uniref:Uncharacterized protein n=1 Tax=Dreissena polymorpha TaxID=45954 RepID=A0A9D4F654_DREPO|nr:hypothetical protein DPMN_145505 [Dreissena polymorpha]
MTYTHMHFDPFSQSSFPLQIFWQSLRGLFILVFLNCWLGKQSMQNMFCLWYPASTTRGKLTAGPVPEYGLHNSHPVDSGLRRHLPGHMAQPDVNHGHYHCRSAHSPHSV